LVLTFWIIWSARAAFKDFIFYFVGCSVVGQHGNMKFIVFQSGVPRASVVVVGFCELPILFFTSVLKLFVLSDHVGDPKIPKAKNTGLSSTQI